MYGPGDTVVCRTDSGRPFPARVLRVVPPGRAGHSLLPSGGYVIAIEGRMFLVPAGFCTDARPDDADTPFTVPAREG